MMVLRIADTVERNRYRIVQQESAVNIEQSEICHSATSPFEDSESFTERGGKAAEVQNNSTASGSAVILVREAGLEPARP